MTPVAILQPDWLFTVNAQLALAGEAALNSLDDDHPLLPACIQQIQEALAMIQELQDYWFNTEYSTLTPDATSGFIQVPGDAISVECVDQLTRYTQRGRFMYDTLHGTKVISLPLYCKVKRLVDYPDLPPVAGWAVHYAAVIGFASSFDADQNKVKEVSGKFSLARASLNSEHIRQAKANIITRPSSAMWHNAIAGNSSRSLPVR